jgi:hypothetical protein
MSFQNGGRQAAETYYYFTMRGLLFTNEPCYNSPDF